MVHVCVGLSGYNGYKCIIIYTSTHPSDAFRRLGVEIVRKLEGHIVGVEFILLNGVFAGVLVVRLELN